MKRLVTLLFVTSAIMIAGCGATGSLTAKQIANITKFLLDEGYVDDIGVVFPNTLGEFREHRYFASCTIDEESYVLNLEQKESNLDYRVFSIVIYNNDYKVLDNLEIMLLKDKDNVALYTGG